MHNIGEFLTELFKNKTTDREVVFLEIGQANSRNNKQAAIRVCCHLRFKGDLIDNTGSGKYIGITALQTIENDFSAFI